MSDLRIKRLDEDGLLLSVKVEGRIAPESLADEEPLAKAFGDDVYSRRILLSLEGVDYINSNGIGWLVVCHKRCAQKGGMLIIHSAPPLVSSVFRIARLDQVFHLSPNAGEARATACQEKS